MLTLSLSLEPLHRVARFPEALPESPALLRARSVRRPSTEPPPRSMGDRCDDAHIVEHLLHGAARRRVAALFGARPQHQDRLVDYQLPRRCVPSHVGRVQLPELTTRRALGGDAFCQPLAVRRVGARQRQQILHRRVCSDRARSHLLLRQTRHVLDQTHAATHPALAAIQSPPQLFEPEPEALHQLEHKPALLERAISVSHPQRSLEQ